MYSRMLRNILNTSAKLSKQKIDKSTKLIFPTSLTVPKLLACTNQLSVQNYSSNKASLNNDWSDEDLSRGQTSSEEYDSDERQEDGNFKCNPKNPQKYFKERDQAKLDKLLQDNPEMEKLKRIIELEIVVLSQDGECVPSKLEPREWIEVLTLKSRGQRKKYYKYLFINEKVDEKIKKKKEEKQIELQQVREERKNATASDEMKYGFGHNFMLRRISNTYINNYQHWNCLKATMFGNKLIYDCSYDSYMSNMEAKSCAKQINESYALNRAHNFPFEIFLTNVNYNSRMIETLHRQIPTLYEKDFPITVSDKSYLELFDRAKLCYLSSNAPSVLEEYDPETIYIIGAYVDKGSKQPVSFGKAKREGIRMAKLPLDKYLKFGTGGGRDLTLNQMCGIMLEIQRNSWQEALKHVPTRKLFESSIRSLENKVRRHMMLEEGQSGRPFDSMTEERQRPFEFRTEDRHRSRRYDSNNTIESVPKPIFSSEPVTDFSHSARAKLREKWNK